MNTKAKLSEVLDAMDFQTHEHRSLLNRKTGEVVTLMEEEIRAAEDDEPLEDYPDWQRTSIKLAQEMLENEEDFVDLPSQFDVHEYDIMERFCFSVEDEETSRALCSSIKGRGAFRRFKDKIHQFGIAEQWYAYRDQALKEIAVAWCEANEIPYVDDCKPALKVKRPPETEKALQYEELLAQLRGLLEGERDFIANAANFAALVFHALPDVSWAGVYRFREGELLLGPFQGKPACTRIPPEKGVCGKAANRLETIVVENVHEFPGHIACDSASNSEIVVPIITEGRLIGVLDLDSTAFDRFDAEDQAGLEKLVEVFLEATDVGDE